MMTRMIPILALVSTLGLAACQEEDGEMENTEVETEEMEVETEEMDEAEVEETQ